ncbi:hypothetical protein [Paraburkholderia mimosarum]|uniref:hypothetical protein n=1 Tax=Paraburkholderia mimosarum TaxID=312026 RepID=UPI0004850320|nr:hypothetical protein [Paraburkholderia mimosarum]
MKSVLASVLAVVACSTFAQSVTTGVSSAGVNFAGVAQQDVGGQTITLTIGNAGASLTKAPSLSPAGVTVGTFSAGLSIGAALGGGFGSTGGTAGTLAGLGVASLP